MSRSIKQVLVSYLFASAALLLTSTLAPAQTDSQSANIPELRDGKQAMANKHFTEATQIYAAYVQSHPKNIEAEMGLADAVLALHEYESAELDYRRVVQQQPENWLAHKNLVIVEAALNRWDEFDRERALLRGARERGAPGITTRESDVIDTFEFHGQHWMVREYYEPVGRSLTRYNFEKFSPNGKVEEYVSLESAAAAAAVLSGSSTRTGDEPVSASEIKDFALNWYTGEAHGTIARYPHGEPSYERVRSAVQRWLRTKT